LWFAPPKPPPLSAEEKKALKAKERAEKPKVKDDPKFVAAARELRDRFLEEAQRNPSLLLPVGKYDVSRSNLLAAPTTSGVPLPLLTAA
jgi:hypothetical protein